MINEALGWGWLVVGFVATCFATPVYWRRGGWARWLWLLGVVPYWPSYLFYWLEHRDFGTAFTSSFFLGICIPFLLARTFLATPAHFASMAGRKAAADFEERQRKELGPFIRRHRDDEV